VPGARLGAEGEVCWHAGMALELGACDFSSNIFSVTVTAAASTADSDATAPQIKLVRPAHRHHHRVTKSTFSF
jgi:hypothetical protein